MRAHARDPLDDVALLRRFPRLRQRLPWIVLGQWPSPVSRLSELERTLGYRGELWVKREDLADPAFGGNKVRTLEPLVAFARERGADRLWTTGAFGSNHAVAMAVHAPRAGLRTGALVFPQPRTDTAAGNLRALAATDSSIEPLLSPASLPLAVAALSLESTRGGERHAIMPPGGASPRGALAHVSASLELATQIAAGALPAPRRLVLAVGSTCTTAGLLVGLALAARLGIGPREPAPITAVRVTPWPITDARAIALLARRTSALLSELIGPAGAFSYAELRARVRVERGFFAGGYGQPLAAGREARALFAAANGPALDEVYTEKSAAAFIALARAREPGPLLYWATRTSAPLALPSEQRVRSLPPPLAGWLAGRPISA